MIAHQAECEIGAVGQAVNVPLLELECLAQVGEVGFILSSVEVSQIDALGDETIVARFDCCHVRGTIALETGPRPVFQEGKQPGQPANAARYV